MPAADPDDAQTALLPVTGPAEALLAELECWRDLLARHLMEQYPGITEPDLNHTILRATMCVLFLRIGEGRGFAGPGTLDLLVHSDGIDRRLSRACADAGLNPGALTVERRYGPGTVPVIPDDALRDVIRAVQSPAFPVPLTAIPLTGLAAVFEQYCGTTMRIAEGYRVRRDRKSVVRYTGSVHVTPRRFVEYVVRETLGGRSGISGRDRGSAIRILDPACGAALFLLAACNFLVRQGTGKPGPAQQAVQDPGEILCRSVFGTDIDPESVAAARFILLLAFIEQSRAPGSGQVTAARIRKVMECLQRSIRCGNALIAPDYFLGKQEHPFNAEERRKVNPFDWQEAFPEIIGNGGFDAVIGAPPPYRPFPVPARDVYLQTHFDTYAKSAGLYGYFIEKGLSLLRPDGTLGFLVPGDFLRSHHARPLRCLLLSRQILRIADTGQSRILQEGEGRLYVLQVRNRPPDMPFAVLHARHDEKKPDDPFSGAQTFTLDQRSLDGGGWRLEDTRANDLAEKIRSAGTLLDQYVMGEIGSGTHRIRNNPFIVDADTKNLLAKKEWWCRRFFVPLPRPADIRRYVVENPVRFVIAAKTTRELRRCRALWKHLKAASESAGTGLEDQGSRGSTGAPELRRLQEPVIVQKVPKIIFAPYQHVPAFAFDPRGSYAIAVPLLAIPRNDPYLAAILNSSLGRFLITSLCPLTDRGYHTGRVALGKFPVITPDFDNLADRTRHEKMVALVTQMLSLHEYLQRAKTDQERRLVQQEMDATDVRIDALVYELYGLTKDDIDLIEEKISNALR
jgi:hypothetical protein